MNINASQRYVPVGNWYPNFLLNWLHLGQAVPSLYCSEMTGPVLGTGCNAEHETQWPGAYGSHGLMGKSYFSTSTITASSGHRGHTSEPRHSHRLRPSTPGPGSPRAAVHQPFPWSLILQQLPCPGVGQAPEHGQLCQSLLAPQPVKDFFFLSSWWVFFAGCGLLLTYPQKGICRRRVRVRGFPLDLHALEMVCPIWKRTSVCLPWHGDKQQETLLHHSCF